ncbi:nucleotidyltransferase domain-containing protein [Methanoregula sp.]|uniref:nucleotidyltransferase domain-containing protein n=1 Tax=Methanoregula sp. TaxID=2052170 RepID=UPI000CABF93B|nr:nucleotidyltransferase domain-containing protein [Methanoregula sp.]PKG31089.1 MAG: nucleotidyltransferase domain-containing protein [Methanoregula sp.]
MRIPDPAIRKSAAAALDRIRTTPGSEHIRFIILYGSAGAGTMKAGSDIDLCISLDGDHHDAARFRHEILSRLPGSTYDIQIFELLPLYVRTEVLRGAVLYPPDPAIVYETASRTIREFDDFKHRLYDYTGEEAMS